ncbi:MAG TPA: retropepsin-like aspartic protease, partial [Gammaproteobacteria bacterium]|nr:retropepsin-like aspartic protease [Gammaproteobacteria bacterium]
VRMGDSLSGEFLVDTGSSHMVIRASTLRALQKQGHARFVKNLTGHMADGRSKVVPIYRIDRIRVGKHCLIEGVEAAVFPDNARPILGLSALRRAAPIQLSVDPPALRLSRCGSTTASRTGDEALARSE